MTKLIDETDLLLYLGETIGISIFLYNFLYAVIITSKWLDKVYISQ